MQIANDNPQFKDDPIWSLLAEGAIRDLIDEKETEDTFPNGSFLQGFQKLGLPFTVILKIQETIAHRAGNAESMVNPDGSAASPLIRVFCQKSTLSRIGQREKLLIGGWGFYIIEKDVDHPTSFQRKCHQLIEIYLYSEG